MTNGNDGGLSGLGRFGHYRLISTVSFQAVPRARIPENCKVTVSQKSRHNLNHRAETE